MVLFTCLQVALLCRKGSASETNWLVWDCCSQVITAADPLAEQSQPMAWVRNPAGPREGDQAIRIALLGLICMKCRLSGSPGELFLW